ncbi:Protein SYM1 [Hondaea fermentalgiana]|uniref:Protein SYM1 n=1 Tax=Hondaea fermentalgiana TaxID=2315210 RepID=A0A2R5GK37_9STRA|nr:Protein SYM1 [Hondaea fermentalgiana]|eukprot:GBG30088.1 Protein SYM1 [Hondaea fermentalgiana]
MPSGTALGASAGFGGILAIMKANPFASQVTIATCKTSLADIIAQKRVEGAEQIDWRRNIIFVMFGCFYLGGVQWMLYVRLFKRLFPSVETFCNQPLREKIKNKEGMKALFSQIGLDIIVFQPFMYFPVFYNFKTLMSTDPEVHASLSNHFSAAFARWRTNFFEDNVGMSFFWFPADLVIYSVPVYLRLPLVHTVSFAWSCILSVFRGDTAHAKKLESA